MHVIGNGVRFGPSNTEFLVLPQSTRSQHMHEVPVLLHMNEVPALLQPAYYCLHFIFVNTHSVIFL